jgi:hypothetical protein
MRSGAKMLSLLSCLVVSLCVWGKEPAKSNEADLLARLSYNSSAVVQRDGVSQVCVAISRGGEYRMIRLTNNRPVERVHGTLSKEQFDKVSKLLESPKFRALSPNRSGLIRQDAESFAAELPVASMPQPDEPTSKERQLHIIVPEEMPQARRIQWLNPDGEDPFPDSVEKIVTWMQTFQPKNGKEFEYAEFPDVCPSEGLRPVQPTMAENGRP